MGGMKRDPYQGGGLRGNLIRGGWEDLIRDGELGRCPLIMGG